MKSRICIVLVNLICEDCMIGDLLTKIGGQWTVSSTTFNNEEVVG